MLSIEILKLEESSAELRIKIPKRRVITEKVYYYSRLDVEKAVLEKLKLENIKFDSFLTPVRAMKNKLSNHLTEQVVKISLIKKEVAKPKPKAKTKKKTLKRKI
tara:strand:- start:285 stop:596 length:312 start_codon:yes stop_codon:yes gene_type:complete